MRRALLAAVVGALTACAHLRPEDVRGLSQTRDWGRALEYLHDGRGWVREEAALVLGRMRAGEARTSLESVLLDRHERPYVRAATATALGGIKDTASIDALAGVAAQADAPPEVKIALIGSLCSYETTEALGAIRQLAKDEDVLVAALAEDRVVSRCGGRAP